MRLTLFALCLMPWHATHSSTLQSALLEVEENLNRNTTRGATQSLEPTLKVPAIATVYTSRDLKEAQDIWQLIRHTPGITVDEGAFGHKMIHIRGIRNILYQNKTILTVNGFRLQDPIGPHFNLEQLPKAAIHRLEILKGVGSEIYGSNAFSGVLAAELKSAEEYQQDYVDIQFGTADSFQNSLTYSDADPKGGRHFIALDFETNDGTHRRSQPHLDYFRQLPNGWLEYLRNTDIARPYRTLPADASNVQYVNENYRGAGTSQFSESWELSWSASKLVRDLSYNNGLETPFYGGIFEYARRQGPGTLLYRPPDIDIPQTFDLHQPIRSFAQREHRMLGLKFQPEPSYGWESEYRISYNRGRETISECDYYLFNTLSEGETFTFSTLFKKQFHPQLKLSIGGDHEWSSFEMYASGNGIQEASEAWLATPLTREFFHLTPAGHLQTAGLFIQARYLPHPRLTFQLATRWNHHSIVGSDLTPKLAAVYSLDAHSALKFSAGRNLRYPSPTELFINHPFARFRGSLHLQPEKQDALDFSYIREWDQARNRIRVTRFDLKLEDMIESFNAFQFQNTTHCITSQGFEFEFKRQFTPAFSGSFSYSVMDYEDPLVQGGSIPGSWSSMAAAILSYKPDPHRFFNLHGRYMSKRTGLVYAGQGDLQDSLVFDFTMGWTLTSGHRLRLDLSNFLDEDYINPLYSFQSHKILPPPQGRRIRLTYSIPF